MGHLKSIARLIRDRVEHLVFLMDYLWVSTSLLLLRIHHHFLCMLLEPDLACMARLHILHTLEQDGARGSRRAARVLGLAAGLGHNQRSDLVHLLQWLLLFAHLGLHLIELIVVDRLCQYGVLEVTIVDGFQDSIS